MPHKSNAIKFIVLLGIVSLFADVTYEGMRSIIGPYLSLLGASGAALGAVLGLGDVIGYSVRGYSGYLSDRTGRYWAITFIGYGINLLAVPMLALAQNWHTAAVLMILERFGKAVRVPARDAMLSYASKHTGRGWGFGIHEALDRFGAFLGPLIMMSLLFYRESYRMGFALLAIPAFAALSALFLARISFPYPRALEPPKASLETKGLTRSFWIYMGAVSCVAAGFTDFALIAFHFQKSAAIPAVWIPLIYAIAMSLAGLSALVIGHLFDRKGVPILIGIALIAASFSPLVFLGSTASIFAGMALWGIALGAQDSTMRAVVANLVSSERRGSAYGLFNLFYGIARAAGSALMGLFYDLSIAYLVLFSIGIQLLAIPFLVFFRRPFRS